MRLATDSDLRLFKRGEKLINVSPKFNWTVEENSGCSSSACISGIMKRSFIIFSVTNCNSVQLSLHIYTVHICTWRELSSIQGHTMTFHLDLFCLTLWCFKHQLDFHNSFTVLKKQTLKRLTSLWVCVCPTRISMLEQIIDKQKLSRMMDRSERIYLKKKQRKENKSVHFFILYLQRPTTL